MVVIKGGTKYTAGDIGTFDVGDNQAGVKWGNCAFA